MAEDWFEDRAEPADGTPCIDCDGTRTVLGTCLDCYPWPEDDAGLDVRPGIFQRRRDAARVLSLWLFLAFTAAFSALAVRVLLF